MQQISLPAKGTVTGTAEIAINASIHDVFAYIPSADSLPRYLKSYGPVHAVARAELQKGPWSAPGAWRILYLETGDTLREELLAFSPPTYFAYSISQFSNFAKYLSNIAYGEWWFEDRGGATNVRWKYTFVPKNALTSLIVSFFMQRYFKTYMQQSLQHAKNDIENAKP